MGACIPYPRPMVCSKHPLTGIHRIMKICGLIPLYSLISFLSVAFPKAYNYLDPWLEFFQSIALVSFFLLLCEFVSPNEDKRTVFFAALEPPEDTGSKPKKPRPGAVPKTPEERLQWYRKKWVALFQYPVIALLVSIATDITEAAHVYCFTSSSLKHAHIWLFLIGQFSLTAAVTAILFFYQGLAKELAQFKPLWKLVIFKLVVFLGFIQGIIFTILRATKVLKPTDTLTYADTQIGLPTLLTCVEMVPISLLFHYAYSYRPYVIGAKIPLKPAAHRDSMMPPPSSYQGGFLGLRAWLAILNPMETIEGIVFAFRMYSELRAHKSSQVNTYKDINDTALEPLNGNGAGMGYDGSDGHNGGYVRPYQAYSDDGMAPGHTYVAPSEANSYTQQHTAYGTDQPPVAPPRMREDANWSYAPTSNSQGA